MWFAFDCEWCLLKPWRDIVCCVLFITTGSHFDNKKYVLRRLRTSPPAPVHRLCLLLIVNGVYNPGVMFVHCVLFITTENHNYVSSPLYIYAFAFDCEWCLLNPWPDVIALCPFLPSWLEVIFIIIMCWGGSDPVSCMRLLLIVNGICWIPCLTL